MAIHIRYNVVVDMPVPVPDHLRAEFTAALEKAAGDHAVDCGLQEVPENEIWAEFIDVDEATACNSRFLALAEKWEKKLTKSREEEE